MRLTDPATEPTQPAVSRAQGDRPTGFDLELAALLAEAAEAHPPPSDGPTLILADARSEAGPGRRQSAAAGPASNADTQQSATPPGRGRRLLGVVLAAAVLLAGLSFALRGNGGTSTRSSLPKTALPGNVGVTVPTGGGSLSDEQFGAPATTNPGRPSSAGTAKVVANTESSPGALAPPVLNPKIVKTGTVELRVAKGAVPGTFDRLTALAAGNGGFVADQKTAEAAGVPNGTITIRVPAAAFEAVLAQARKLGKVQSGSTSGQDVTAEYTDVDARLKALTGERDQLSLVLSSAQNVGDILAVRDRINGVQTEIEQLQGRQNVLDNEVSLSTLTVSVSEPDGDRPVPVTKGERSGFDKAWQDALHGFNSGVQGLIAGSGRALLVLLCAGVMLVAARFVWRAARRRAV